jgi:hypothetical protein
MQHAKNKTDKGLITRKVALLFGLKYSTFSFNLIWIWKVVCNMFSQLKEINLDILEEHYPKGKKKKTNQDIWVDVDDIWLAFNNFAIKWWVLIRLVELTIDSIILSRYEVLKVEI